MHRKNNVWNVSLMFKGKRKEADRFFSIVALLLISIFFFGISHSESAENKGEEIIWLEFKLPPHYDAERKSILESDDIKSKTDYKKYEEDKNKYENKYRSEYEKRYSYNPEFLKRNPFKYPDFKRLKMNYDAIALIDIDGDGQHDNAYVVADIIKEGGFAGQAHIMHYQRKPDGFWKLSTSMYTQDDVGIRTKTGEFVTSRCQKSGVFVSPRGAIRAIDFQNEAKKMKKDAAKIISIVQKELSAEIQKAKEEYKKETNLNYQEELRIAGIFYDVNGDGKPDILATVNDPKYMYMYSDGKRMPTGSRYQLFCFGEKGCEHYLFLNKGDSGWEKVSLGYAKCIGVSTAHDKGIQEIYTETVTAEWNGATYSVIPHTPNWIVRK